MMLARRTGKTERARRATGSLYRSYFRTLYLSRLAWVAFWGCFVYFLLWSIPLFGIGLSKDDYTPQFAVTMAFAGCLHAPGVALGDVADGGASQARGARGLGVAIRRDDRHAHTKSLV